MTVAKIVARARTRRLRSIPAPDKVAPPSGHDADVVRLPDRGGHRSAPSGGHVGGGTPKGAA